MSDNARIPADSAISALRAEIRDFVVDILPPDLRHLVSAQARVTPLTDAEMAQAAPFLLARVEALETDLSAVRAVLAPLLDETDSLGYCHFCCGQSWDGDVFVNSYGEPEDWDDGAGEIIHHAPDCPVLRADELLGREP